MQDEAAFYSPLQYQPQWLWLGLVLVLIIGGAWYAWIFRPARKMVAHHEDPARQVTVVPDLETLRAACLAAINATASDADAGRYPSATRTSGSASSCGSSPERPPACQ